MMKLGVTVTWRARRFGVALRMTSAITSCEHPRRFLDEQQRGPFRRWWHEHTFVGLADSRTQMIAYAADRSPDLAKCAGERWRRGGQMNLPTH